MIKSERIGLKRRKRRRIAKIHKELEKQRVSAFRNKVFKNRTKKAKVPRVLKPYRIIRLQAHYEKLESGIRALEASNPKREQMIKRLGEIKKKLGK